MIMSLPSWERGLKSVDRATERLGFASLPSWERGLKLMEHQVHHISA